MRFRAHVLDSASEFTKTAHYCCRLRTRTRKSDQLGTVRTGISSLHNPLCQKRQSHCVETGLPIRTGITLYENWPTVPYRHANETSTLEVTKPGNPGV